jgi:hypothetical protein
VRILFVAEKKTVKLRVKANPPVVGDSKENAIFLFVH